MSKDTDPLAPDEAVQRLKFYQKGTLTVGNRLVSETARTVQASEARANSLTCGHRACQGCGEALGARYAIDTAMRATNGNLIAVNATGCLEVFTTPYPETSWQMPWMHSLFGNAAAVATGVAAALRAKGQTDTRVVAQGGDGGTTDIGFGCLSGMFERNDDVLYICYDNEAYMNTGVQRSSATPPAARTATTMAVGAAPGNAFGQGKNVPLIAMAHGIPYVATASVAYLRDLEEKVSRAMTVRGARYIHILVPCPLGWGAQPHDTIKLARLAVETGLFPLFEAEHGEVVRTTPIRHRVPVEEYLKPQKRFAHLFGKVPAVDTIARIQEMADRILSELEEYPQDNPVALLNTVVEPAGGDAELAVLEAALHLLLTNKEIVYPIIRIRNAASPKVETRAEDLARLIKFDTEAHRWAYNNADPQRNVAEIRITDIGLTKARGLLERRGYRWWRQSSSN